MFDGFRLLRGWLSRACSWSRRRSNAAGRSRCGRISGGRTIEVKAVPDSRQTVRGSGQSHDGYIGQRELTSWHQHPMRRRAGHRRSVAFGSYRASSTGIVLTRVPTPCLRVAHTHIYQNLLPIRRHLTPDRRTFLVNKDLN